MSLSAVVEAMCCKMFLETSWLVEVCEVEYQAVEEGLRHNAGTLEIAYVDPQAYVFFEYKCGLHQLSAYYRTSSHGSAKSGQFTNFGAELAGMNNIRGFTKAKGSVQ